MVMQWLIKHAAAMVSLLEGQRTRDPVANFTENSYPFPQSTCSTFSVGQNTRQCKQAGGEFLQWSTIRTEMITENRVAEYF